MVGRAPATLLSLSTGLVPKAQSPSLRHATGTQANTWSRALDAWPAPARGRCSLVVSLSWTCGDRTRLSLWVSGPRLGPVQGRQDPEEPRPESCPSAVQSCACPQGHRENGVVAPGGDTES